MCERERDSVCVCVFVCFCARVHHLGFDDSPFGMGIIAAVRFAGHTTPGHRGTIDTMRLLLFVSFYE